MSVTIIIVFLVLIANLHNISGITTNDAVHHNNSTTTNSTKRDAKRLMNDLCENYNSAERPVLVKSSTVHVRLDPVLINILEVDEVREAITVNFWMRMYWVDEFLHWDPNEYDGTNELYIPQNMVWKPDIVLYNNLERVDHVDSEILFVKVNSSGYVQYLFPAIYEVSCSIDIRYFPFDTQNCSLKFGSWSFHGFAVDLHITHKVLSLGNFKTNPEWDLKATDVVKNSIVYSCCPEPFPDLTVSLLLKRKPMFYIITLIFPAFVITFLSLIGLFSPSHAGGDREEKMTMGMTCLLTIAVLLIMVAEQLPKTSKVIPMLGVFYMYQVFLCLAATLCTVLIMNLEKQGHYGHKPPQWLKRWCIDILPVYLGMRRPRFKRKDIKVEDVSQTQTKKPKRSVTAFSDINDFDCNGPLRSHYYEAAILKKLNEIHKRSLKSDKQDDIVDEWDQICDCIDRACMWIFVILFLFGTMILFYGL